MDKFITALRKLREHRLSPELISERELKVTLEEIASQLRRNMPLYKIVHTNIAWYYQYSRPTYIRHGNKLMISLFIPLSSNCKRYYLYKVESFPVPAPDQPEFYTYLVNDVEVFGINKAKTHFLELKLADVEKYQQYSTIHCQRTTKVYHSQYPTCTMALYTHDSVQIKKVCKFQLESTL